MATTLIVAGALLIGGLTPASASAYEVPPPAYQWATHRTGVPAEVLYALALQESGTVLRGQVIPWPWTLNVAGKPYRFSSSEAACSALLQSIRNVGAKAVDVGLGQINIGWNGKRFLRPCDALDPYRNLAVATDLLREHKTADNDWVTAAGRYHRPAGGVPAARYRRSFAQHLSRITRPSLQGTKTP